MVRALICPYLLDTGVARGRNGGTEPLRVALPQRRQRAENAAMEGHLGLSPPAIHAAAAAAAAARQLHTSCCPAARLLPQQRLVPLAQPPGQLVLHVSHARVRGCCLQHTASRRHLPSSRPEASRSTRPPPPPPPTHTTLRAAPHPAQPVLPPPPLPHPTPPHALLPALLSTSYPPVMPGLQVPAGTGPPCAYTPGAAAPPAACAWQQRWGRRRRRRHPGRRR